MSNFHTSVLLQETITNLHIIKGAKYIDATLGGGGHTKAILQYGGRVLGIDQDTDALEYVRKNIQSKALTLVHGNFTHLTDIAKANGFVPADGILFDLGVSSFQLDTAERGFSFMKEAPLDMRMNREQAVKAIDLVNGLHKGELTELFSKLGEEPFAKKIAQAIVNERVNKHIETTTQLARIIEKTTRRAEKGIHPATRVFQALRIAVNDELHSVKQALPSAVNLLSSKGRLVVISFHSLEDRIVKNAFLEFEEQKLGNILSKKPIMPRSEEIFQNPRSRSAKLRVIEKI